ncbi:hypothetical protein M011DRAFT_25269 [Sporormia fimetaria CBS 119925]|uniref:Uncharacterized protein n=1 Tax=Sporormia fimetaria CBS 119925 TaxID=1340428 RepID=A0A6A6VBG5_9PLEO|nr:hypothetical protein M011DRAFT_25269 [Sporormia fimetaria CBS 119925]
MPSTSHLRLQTTFEPVSAETTRARFVAAPPQKKQKMSLTQTYYIAASARNKLGREACRADHNLRLLVGHANLLDSLMIELADAEKKQEEWFNSTVRKADEPRHVQWADQMIPEDDEDSDTQSDSGSDSDFYDEDGDFDMIVTEARRSKPVKVTTTQYRDQDEEGFYDDQEDDEELALTRVPSQSPPELVHDEDSEDESHSPPTTPPTATMPFSDKEAMLTTSFYEKQSSYHSDYIIQDSSTPLISGY